MLPVLFGVLGLGAAAALASEERNRYGAVTLWQGGRGPRAGTGVVSGMGGRAPDDPYGWDLPSSVIANWTSGTIYGAEDDYGFMILGIPFGKESRLEHLEKKIERAKEKKAEYEKQAAAVTDAAQLERLAAKIAKFETKIDKWEDKKENIEMRMGALEEAFGARGEDIVASQMLDTVEMLANQVLSSAKKLRGKPRGRKAYQHLLTLVSNYDQLVSLVDAVLRPALQSYSMGVVRDAGAAPPQMEISPMGFGFAQRRKAPEPEPLSPELQAAVVRAKAAAEAYRQARATEPEAVEAMEEAYEEQPLFKAGRQFAERIRTVKKYGFYDSLGDKVSDEMFGPDFG